MKIALIFCTELGVLEAQSILLTSSIRKYLEVCSYDLHAYAPRLKSQPSLATLLYLEKLGVQVNSRNINKDLIKYPIANKVLVCKHFEAQYPRKENTIFIDSDTVFLNQINFRLLKNKRLYLRPVDNKGPGSEGFEDPNDIFWQQIFKLCDVDLPEPNVWTTVRPKLIRNYFNAGFIWVNGIPGFFQQWYDDFMTIINSDLRPFGYKSRDGDDFRCLDQVALAVTATRYQEYLEILPETYNYPIPFRPIMKNRSDHPKFDDLVHVHYHKWFQHPGFLDHITSDEEKQSEQYKWLKKHLPLQPEIDGPFKC